MDIFDVLDALEELKGRKLDWSVWCNGVSFTFKAEIKEIYDDQNMNCLIFRFKSRDFKHFNVRHPLKLGIGENEEIVRYTIATRDEGTVYIQYEKDRN